MKSSEIRWRSTVLEACKAITGPQGSHTREPGQIHGQHQSTQAKMLQPKTRPYTAEFFRLAGQLYDPTKPRVEPTADDEIPDEDNEEDMLD